jgi:hypothetical protein
MLHLGEKLNLLHNGSYRFALLAQDTAIRKKIIKRYAKLLGSLLADITLPV